MIRGWFNFKNVMLKGLCIMSIQLLIFDVLFCVIFCVHVGPGSCKIELNSFQAGCCEQ